MSVLVELICDGGPAFGSGHLRRTQALACELEHRDYRARIRPMSKQAYEFFVGDPRLDVRGPAALRVTDLPDARAAEVRRACESHVPCVALDYFGTAAPALTISVRERCASAPGHRVSGLHYSIVRPDIIAQPRGLAGEGVLVMLGGADVRGNGAAIATKLAELGQDVSLVVGPFAKRQEPAASVAVLHAPPDLPERMARCAWAVASGGVSMSEFLYLGKAIFVVPQTEPELALAQVVASHGALLGLGTDSLKVPTQSDLERCASAGVQLIDGRGVERISDEVEVVIHECRTAAKTLGEVA